MSKKLEKDLFDQNDELEGGQPSQTAPETPDFAEPGPQEDGSSSEETAPPQTDSGDDEFSAGGQIPGATQLQDVPFVQTDPEAAKDFPECEEDPKQDEPLPQTDAETAPDEEDPSAELQPEADTPHSSQTGPEDDADDAARADSSAPKAKVKRPTAKTGKKAAKNAASSAQPAAGAQVRTKMNAFPDASGTGGESALATPAARRTGRAASTGAATFSGQSAAALRSVKNAGPAIVSIDTERSVESDADKKRNAFLDLVESMKGRKILSGTIQGVERAEDNPDLSFAVVYHGDFKVIIPADEAVERPSDFRGREPGDVMHYLLTKRLGAEVDFIVKGTDPESGMAAASRLEAMAQKRKDYYFGTDRDGYNLMYEGVIAEARVISVIRAGIFVEIFGAECYISLRELSYQRWLDAAAHYQTGQRVLVKILGINREDRSSVRVAASVKQAGEDPYEKALRRYSVGNRYVGTVSLVDTTGVFVSLDGGIDCLCAYPKRGRPPRGSQVTVRILGINKETNRIWGAITHMTTAR